MRSGVMLTVLFVALCLACLAPWLYVQPGMGISADAAWLIGAAEHFLAGKHMTEAYYDSNPPMCYMIFVPVVLLMKLGLPLWHAHTVFTFALASGSFIAIALILRRWNLSSERYWGILASWILGALLIAQHEFGQKDHFIALTILPMLLVHLALTQGKKIPWVLMLAVFFIAVPCILVKPHYGLLSVVALAHRAWIQRRFSVCFDPDFLALACGVVFYGVAIALWFPDFITVVLPNSLNLYVSRISIDVFWTAFGLLLLSTCLLILSIACSQKDSASQISVFLNIMGALASLVFLLQFKGFGVHMLPALAILFPGAFTTLTLLWPRFFQSSSALYTSLIVVGLIFSGYGISSSAGSYPTHQDYVNSSLAQMVRAKASGSSFFMQSSSTNIIVPVSVYTGIPVASRFSLMWFLPGLGGPCKVEEKAVCDQRNQTRSYFSEILAKDIQFHRPALIALQATPPQENDLLQFMQDSETFQRAWGHYKKEGKYTLDYKELFPRQESSLYPPVTYDIYIRK